VALPGVVVVVVSEVAAPGSSGTPLMPRPWSATRNWTTVNSSVSLPSGQRTVTSARRTDSSMAGRMMGNASSRAMPSRAPGSTPALSMSLPPMELVALMGGGSAPGAPGAATPPAAVVPSPSASTTSGRTMRSMRQTQVKPSISPSSQHPSSPSSSTAGRPSVATCSSISPILQRARSVAVVIRSARMPTRSAPA
jgi:hypothetical protein